MKLRILLILSLAVAVMASGSDLYPTPTAWSWGSMASITQRLIASGTVLPPVASASVGELFLDVSAVPYVLYRRAESTWVQVGGSGVGSSSSLSVGTLYVGSGSYDTTIENIGTGTLQIASYIRLIPSSSPPSGALSGTLWMNASGEVSIYDGVATWNRLLDNGGWQDLRVSLLSTNAGGTNAPTPVKILGNGGSQGIFAYGFSQTTEQELYTSVQLPHGIRKTIVSPHIHWMSTTNTVGTVSWGIEYALYNYGSSGPTATTIATAPQVTTGASYTHQILQFPDINISAAKDSAVLVIRVFRVAGDPTDDYNTTAIGTDFDLHYQIDRAGSRTIYGDN
jgi:hypothetical protein